MFEDLELFSDSEYSSSDELFTYESDNIIIKKIIV